MRGIEKSRPLGGGPKGHARQLAFSALRTAFMALVVVVAVAPIAWVIMSSFKSNQEILNSAIALPSSFSLDGYRIALELAPIQQYFANSVVISVLGTVVNVLFLAMAAYSFARVQFRGKALLYTIFCSALVIPMTSLMHPVYMVINKLGLYDSKTGLVIVYAALGLPISLMVLRSYFLSVPQSLEEAAYVDGAGFVRTFVQIMLPVARPALASAGVLQFLTCWNEFTYALVLTNSASVRTLPLSLGYFTSQFSYNYTAMFAAITVAVVPSILVFAIFQEQVVSSMVAGSVKE